MICLVNPVESPAVKRLTLKTAIACDAVSEWDELMKKGFYYDARRVLVAAASVVCEVFGKDEFEAMWWRSIDAQHELGTRTLDA